MEKAIWDDHHTTVFCDICKEEIDNNNRPLACLNRRGYKNLGQKFFASTGKILTKRQFKNKWDLLKKEYTQFMELKNAATGLGWDYEKKTIEADENWWKINLQKYPKRAKYKKKGLSNLDELDAMFDKAHVTGFTSTIPGEISDSTNDEDDDIVEILDCKEHDLSPLKVDNTPTDDKKSENKVSSKDGKTAKEGKQKKNVKRKAKYIDELAKEDKNAFLREYKVTLGNINSEIAATLSSPSVPTMKEVLTLMKECGAKEGTPLYFTATDLVMQPNYRELFVLIETKEGRLDWLQRKHDQINN